MMYRAIIVLFFAFSALLPTPALAVDGIVDTTLQGNYSAPTFTALTSIPGVQEAADSKSIAILLNNLYRICIGAAAVIAVLKIIQGGVTYMLGDSVTEKKEAKHHITMAVLGLVFILSPYLVFNIIDPRILSLDIDVSGLTPDAVTPTTATPTTTQSPIALENTCTNSSYQTTLQSSLDTYRQTHPTGEARLEINPYGQAGMGCCRAVTDTDGSHCVAGSSHSFSNTGGAINGTGELRFSYTCTCSSRGVPRADAPWKVNEVSIRFDYRNVDAPDNLKNSTPHTMRVANTNQTFPTKEACESTTGFGQAQLYPSITGGAYACPQTGGGSCPQRVSWLRNQSVDSLPSGTLTLQSRSCIQP